MADDEMEPATPVDAGAGLATALIVLTSVMLLLAFFATEKLLGDRYNEGMLASNK